MKTKLFISLSIIVTVVIASCNIYNPVEPVPSYIHIDNITVTIPAGQQGTSGQGSASSKITDAWVYIDDQLIGCFEMPCTVPVLYDGFHTLKIRPGIKVNGISATRSPYPFYDNYYQAVNLTRGEITYVKNATVPYLSLMTGVAHFPHIEDFEFGTVMRATPTVSESPLLLYPAGDPNIFEGSHSAYGSLNSSQSTFECGFADSIHLNRSGANVFVEMNYKCNYPLTVCLRYYNAIGNTSGGPIEAITLSPIDHWNKVYVYLTPAIGQSGNGDIRYRVCFIMSAPSHSDSLWCAMDNIKIVQ